MTTTPQPTDGAIALCEIHGPRYVRGCAYCAGDLTTLETSTPDDSRTQGLISKMQKWAADCQDSDDAETDLTGVFLPETYSGDFYDVMTAAVELLRTRPAQLGGGVVSDEMVSDALEHAWAANYVEGQVVSEPFMRRVIRSGIVYALGKGGR